jgi:MoxR-like ATPase
MLELRSGGDSDRQVCMAYSNLFNEQYYTEAGCGKRILIQGEPAVGKTTLCTSIIED